MTPSVGTSTAIHSYGPYGEPNIATGIRFRYTGQQSPSSSTPAPNGSSAEGSPAA